jgi:hypothetical protein
MASGRTLNIKKLNHRGTESQRASQRRASISPVFPFLPVFLCGGSPCPCDSVVQKAMASGRTQDIKKLNHRDTETQRASQRVSLDGLMNGLGARIGNGRAGQEPRRLDLPG